MYAGEEAHIDDVQAEPKQPLRDKSKDQGEELVELKLSLLKEKTIITRKSSNITDTAKASNNKQLTTSSNKLKPCYFSLVVKITKIAGELERRFRREQWQSLSCLSARRIVTTLRTSSVVRMVSS